MPFYKSNRSSFRNFILAKYERLTGQIENSSLPYFMAIDPSSICQLRCPFCPTGVENAARKDHRELKFRNRTMMVQELFNSLIEELGPTLFYLLFYNWGEPLLNRQLPVFIQKAKTYNIYCEIHTNLSLHLTDEYMERLLSSGIDEIDASIDGFSDESYKIYRQGGNFELAKSNIERLAAIRNRLGLKTKIVWNLLVFSFNEGEIEDCRKYCKDIGIEFNRREAFIDTQSHPDWLPSYRRHELDPKNPGTSSESQAPAPKEASCSWHYAMSVVNSDGSVSPCCAPWEQEYDFGSYSPGNNKFKDIWNNEYFRKSRAAFQSVQLEGLSNIHTLCERCPYPPSIMNQYVHYERHIIDNFWDTNDGKDESLIQAFRLISSSDKFVEYCSQNYNDLFVPDDQAEAGVFKRNNLMRWVSRMINSHP